MRALGRTSVPRRSAASATPSAAAPAPSFRVGLESAGVLTLTASTAAAAPLRFHGVWMRHQCNSYLHPTTKERLVDPAEIAPQQALLAGATVRGDEVEVEWCDAHRSTFSARWLVEHAYSELPSLPALERVVGGASRVPVPDSALVAQLPADLKSVEIPWAERSPKRFLSTLQKHGLFMLTGGPVTETVDETVALVHDLFSPRIVESHFGLVEDLRTDNSTNKNTDQLGYTNEAVLPHTDLPFVDAPPSIQLLQSLRVAQRGGASALVDAAGAAEYLRVRHPWAFSLLTEVPVRFSRRQRNYQSDHVSPLLRLEGGRLAQVRYSYFSMAPFRVPFALMEPFYAAYALFTRIVREPSNQYSKQLQPGDLVLYDNHRMLHARTSFAGARWVRGVYLDRDEVYAKMSQ